MNILKTQENPKAFQDYTIIKGISFVSELFEKDYNLIFLADRWFNSQAVLKHIDSLGHTFCIRLKGNLKIQVFDKKEGHYIRKYTKIFICLSKSF